MILFVSDERKYLFLADKVPGKVNTFPFLFSNKILVIRTGIHKMLDRIKKNREDSDQTASDLGSTLFG